MKDCLKYQEMISAMLDGELTHEQQRELEEHLLLCPECRAMHTAFLSLSEALDGDVTSVPARLHDKIMTGVKAVEKKRKRPLLTVLRPYMAAAACLVVIVAAVLAAREGGLLDGTTKAADNCAAPDNAKSYQYASTESATVEAKEVEAEETAVQDAAPAEGLIKSQEKAEMDQIESVTEDTTAESSTVETTPDPIELDAVECLLTTTVDGTVVTEALSETDTKVWISTLILTGDKYAENVDPSLIRHSMAITRENGEVYTLYLYYANGKQLMLSRQEDGSEAIEVKEIRDFTTYAEETEADK